MMGKGMKKDETANRAVARYDRAFIPMSLSHSIERQKDNSYLTIFTSNLKSTKGITKTDIVAQFTFSEEELRKMPFRLEGYPDPVAFESAGKFYVGNMLGKNRDRTTALRTAINAFISDSFKQGSASDSEIYEFVVQKLQTGRYKAALKEIGKRESLLKMALKPPTW